MLRLASIIAGTICAGQSPVEEGRANTRALLHGAFGDLVKSMQEQFLQEDHAMLVGRKFSVDWSLTAAILLSDIVRGAPPEHWIANLDDGYGHAAPLALVPAEIPDEIAVGCDRLQRATRPLCFEYLAERTLAAGAEVPAAIAWLCEIGASETRLRTNWYEPQLGQRGVDFPLPPDRTLLSWTTDLMRVRVLGESADWALKWPSDPPRLDHVGDAYDLFDGLRSWHWAIQSRHAALDAAGQPVELGLERLPARELRWTRISIDEWSLAIELRPASAIRHGGFVVKADGIDEATLPVGRPIALIPIVAPKTRVTISFVAQPDGLHGFPLGTFLPRQLALFVDGTQVASAGLHSLSCADATTSFTRASSAAEADWEGALARIRLAQDLDAPPAPFSESQLTAEAGAATLRARLTANAWIFALRGDIPSLMLALDRAQDLRVANGLAHHELAALQTFAESLIIGHAPASTMQALRVRHALAASALSSDALAFACLAATGSGRFWAALDIARTAVAQSPDDSPAQRVWREAEAEITKWAVDPSAHTAFGADPAVLLLSEEIASQMGRAHETTASPQPPAAREPTAALETPTSTVDGKAAGIAHRKLKRILDQLLESPFRNHDLTRDHRSASHRDGRPETHSLHPTWSDSTKHTSFEVTSVAPAQRVLCQSVG